MKPNLLLTKVILPSRRSDLLRRQRLLDFLHNYIERRLVLVSASAGYGKTSLLVDFADDTQLPVCWYSLDAADADPLVFLEYLVASIQRRFPTFGKHTLSVLSNPENARNLDECVGALVTDIHEQVDTLFVAVLDDFHSIEESEPVNRLIDRLLLYLPENAHLIIASRTIPANLTLTRLAARQQVAGLGVSDLRFNVGEIRKLMEHNHGIAITDDTAEDLAAQSEGWITGIILTTPMLWRGVLREWVKGHAPGSQVFEYLAAEVLAQQSPELQQFLLETSILPQLDITWCNELLGRKDAQAVLALAYKRNLFLTELQELGFRYHPLFREFLQTRFEQTLPARFKELQQQAAALFERHGKMDLAVEFRLAAGEPNLAASLLETLVEEYYDLGRWATLRRWLEALPPPLLRQHPVLLLFEAILTSDSGAIDDALRLYDESLLEFERRHDKAHMARTVVELARSEPDPQRIIEKAERALKLFAPNDYALHAQAHQAMGLALGHHGDFVGAIPLMERASSLYALANNRPLQLEAENALGSLYLITGARVRADTHFENVLNYARRLGHVARIANALNSIAVSRYHRGELDTALEFLHEARDQAIKSGNLRIEAYVLASLGDVYRDQGNLEQALEVYSETASIGERIQERFLITFARIAVGEVWRVSGDFNTAHSVLESALQAAQAHRSDYEIGLVQRAIGALRLDEKQVEAAVQHLDHALSLLERVRDQREIGRCHLAWGLAEYQRKRYKEALLHLRKVVEIAKGLGEDQFLVSSASQARELFDFAIKRRVGVAFFRQLRDKLPGHPLQSVPLSLVRESFAPLEVYTFGEARVYCEGNLVNFQTAQAKELFLFFATQPGEWRKEQVLDAMWEGEATNQAKDQFNSSVYRIRRALYPESISFHNGVYQLNPEVVCSIDADEFEDKVGEAKARQGEEKLELLEHAIQLYKGKYLQDVYADWSAPRRQELRVLYTDTLAELAQNRVQLGEPQRGLELYQKLLAEDPEREETYREVIELYLSQGNRPAALAAYQECAARVRDGLGLDLSPETEALYQRLISSR